MYEQLGRFNTLSDPTNRSYTPFIGLAGRSDEAKVMFRSHLLMLEKGDVRYPEFHEY